MNGPTVLLLAVLRAVPPAPPVQAEPAPPPPPSITAPAAGFECGRQLDSRWRIALLSARHQLAFAPQPAPLQAGRHFALDIVVCPRLGGPLPQAVRVDADMPAHQHGMNYRPTVRALGDGRYRAEGLLLHMSGRWRLVFELSADGRIDRLSHDIDLP